MCYSFRFFERLCKGGACFKHIRSKVGLGLVGAWNRSTYETFAPLYSKHFGFGQHKLRDK